jgi:hypothetical protein
MADFLSLLDYIKGFQDSDEAVTVFRLLVTSRKGHVDDEKDVSTVVTEQRYLFNFALLI